MAGARRRCENVPVILIPVLLIKGYPAARMAGVSADDRAEIEVGGKMNCALLGSGLPWITIRNDERLPYFAALERASVHDDIEPFFLFVLRYVREAIKEVGRS